MEAERLYTKQPSRTIQQKRGGEGALEMVDNRPAGILQAMSERPIQRVEDDEDTLQGKFAQPIQRMEDDEDAVQGKFEQPIQRMEDDEDTMQGKFEAPVQKKNLTGMPDNLKAGIEDLSGFSMDDVRVHYGSSKPAAVQAHAYTQGTDIHIAPGQERHLPHEAWHVAQQMAGRVEPTTEIGGMPVNDNAALEHEADVMGARANSYSLCFLKTNLVSKYNIQSDSVQRSLKSNIEEAEKLLKIHPNTANVVLVENANTIEFLSTNTENSERIREFVNKHYDEIQSMGGGAFNADLNCIFVMNDTPYRTLVHEMGHMKQYNVFGYPYKEMPLNLRETHNIIVNENKAHIYSIPDNLKHVYLEVTPNLAYRQEYKGNSYLNSNNSYYRIGYTNLPTTKYTPSAFYDEVNKLPFYYHKAITEMIIVANRVDKNIYGKLQDGRVLNLREALFNFIYSSLL